MNNEAKTFKGVVPCTLCFFMRGEEILMARKTRTFLVGKWTGYGGKVEKEKGLSVRETAIDEAFDESGKGLKVEDEDLEYCGRITFHNHDESGREIFAIVVFVYRVRKWTGECASSVEMEDPIWFPNDPRLFPWDKAPCGDRDWLPPVLAGKFVVADIYYRPDKNSLLRPSEVRIVSQLPPDRWDFEDRLP